MDLYIIGGATASGKTALSIEIAKKLNGEIVNADSMQIYKYMDIGTAKPTLEERQGIPHHLIDIAEPDENFSVARYCSTAHSVISDIHNRGKLPIMVGGTGLYIDSVAENIQFADIDSDENYRREMTALAEIKGNEHIYNLLLDIDPESAAKIEKNDTKRIIRALEIFHISGITKSEFDLRSKSVPSPYNVKMFCINMDREILYDRINRRVDIMFDNGLADEVANILNMGVSIDCTSMQAIGYKETARYINGEITLEEAKETIKKVTRNYAKRQLTWFRRNENTTWIEHNESLMDYIN